MNEIKLCDVADCARVRLASEEEVAKTIGTSIGYAGIVNLPDGIRVFLDDSLHGLCNFETGANKDNYHAVNVNFERDVPKPKQFYEIKIARQGDLDPKTDKPMKVEKAVEVGNVFSLGTKFSAPFNITVMTEQGESITPIMGCYGLGVSRLMGAIAEFMSDDRGLVWPKNVAPFQVYLASLGATQEVEKAADEAYKHLTAAGIGVLYDDRKAITAGEKFADADLLGIPYRVVISEKTIAARQFEIKARTAQETKLLNLEDLIKTVS